MGACGGPGRAGGQPPLDRPAAGQSQKQGAQQGARARRPDRRPSTSGRVAFRVVSEAPPVDCADRQKGRHSTGGSRVIPQRSTNPAQLCLTSEIGRDRVYSKWFDRGMTAGTLQAPICCMRPGRPLFPAPLPRPLALAQARLPGGLLLLGSHGMMYHSRLAQSLEPPWSLGHELHPLDLQLCSRKAHHHLQSLALQHHPVWQSPQQCGLRAGNLAPVGLASRSCMPAMPAAPQSHHRG